MPDYRDDHDREMAKWAHVRVAQEREERQALALSDLSGIYEGYYPEDDD